MTDKENLLRAFNIVADYYMWHHDNPSKFHEEAYCNEWNNYVCEFFPKTLCGRCKWTTSDYPAMERENPLIFALFNTDQGQDLLLMGNKRESEWPEILERIEAELAEGE